MPARFASFARLTVRRPSRQVVTGMALIAFSGFLATGCSTSPTTTTATKPPQVRIWRVGQDSDTLSGIITDFKTNHSDVQVTYKKQKLAGYELTALKSLSARQGPDIWSMPADWLADYDGQIYGLPDNFFTDPNNPKATPPKPVDLVKQLYPAGIASQITRTDGKVMGLPSNVDTLRLYYNPNFFDATVQDFIKAQGNSAKDEVIQPVRQLLSHPPTTWNELLQQVPYLTKRDGNTITRSAIALGTADNVPDSNEILQALMMQNGAQIVSSDRRDALFNVQESTPAGSVIRPGQKALEFYTSFADPSKQNYSWNPSMPQVVDAFAQGKVAMVIGFSDFARNLYAKYPLIHATQAPLPQISTTQTPVNLITFYVESVTKTADNFNMAYSFLYAYGGNSTIDNLAKEAGLQSPYLKTLKANTDDFLNAQVLTGQAVYKANHTQFDDAFRQMILDVSQNGINSEQAINNANEKVTQLLQQNAGS